MSRERGDEGMSLVEVVMAMFLLGVISLAILPLLIGVTRLSAVNDDRAAANSVADARLARITAAYPSTAGSPAACTALKNNATLVGTETDPATRLTSTATLGICPTAIGTIPLTITVLQDAADPDSALVTVATNVLVSP